MHPRLLAPFDAFERRKRNFLSQLAALDDAQRHFHPGPGVWSLLDVADHLAKIEGVVADALDRNLPPEKLRRRWRHRLSYLALLVALRSPLRVKVPQGAGPVVPDSDLAFDEVAASWAANRARLAAQLGRYGGADLSRPVIRHPVAGPADPTQVIGFLNAHFDHHLHQVRRIRSAPGFPAGG